MIAGLMVFVRFNPLGNEFHIDPEIAQKPKISGHALVRSDGRLDSPLYEMSAEDLAVRLEEIILTTPRTTHFAGDIEDDFATYVTRSRLWGFPDIANVKIVDRGENRSEVVILSRLRYGAYDLGVNQARVEDWLEQLSLD
jgi:uncharacterized protein (DUF1499 family)